MPTLPSSSSCTALPDVLRDDLRVARDFAEQALAEGTRTAYQSDWRIFEEWCHTRSVEALPASPAAVAGFLAAMAERGLRPSTIARRCAAIRHVTVSPESTRSRPNATIVKTTVAGLRRSLSAAPAKKSPATADLAKRMANAMPGNSLKGKRDAALTMLGFPGALRKSEVVALSHEAFTRAFREQFGLTPESVRAQRRLCDIELVEPIRLNETLIPDLKPALITAGRCSSPDWESATHGRPARLPRRNGSAPCSASEISRAG